MIKLLIDYREKKILDYFKDHKNKENIEKKNLLVGDIIFTYDNEKILIIERKTIKDLMSSITDGRYKEQKFRLMKNNNINNLLILLEGEIEEPKFGYMKKKNVLGSIINTMFRDNINIYKTFDIDETCYFIECILNKLLKKETKNFTKLLNLENIKDNQENQSYCDTIKLSKKSNFITNSRCIKYVYKRYI